MNYNYRYRIEPSEAVQVELERHIDTCRQLYNHFLYELRNIDEYLSYTAMQNMLPDLKDWWDDLNDVYSKVLQIVARRVSDNLDRLKDQKDNGRKVGTLKWKPPREYRSLTYNQSGFELKNTSDQTTLELSKIGEIPIHLHRDIPDDASVKQVTVKQEKTGEWYATFGIETEDDTLEKPVLVEVDRENMVGIDVGIIKYAHDTDSTIVGSLDLDAEYERLEREHRALSRKEQGSQNWHAQRRRVARIHARIVQKRRDFLHKLSAYYAREYDFVAVEDLDVHGMMQLPSNSRNRASASWRTFIDFLEYKCDREGTHFVKVEPEGTTQECAECGVEVEKALWVREHSCPTCGFETDRDENAAYNVLQRGLQELGLGHAEVTPAETALPTSATGGSSTVVDAKCVVETGSPTLKERATTVASE
ncbi:transposase [Salinadaptatus halalkaliphilus]|uniref:Transposase n=1 Tax=Salinadaptatus halalkaliphilus TaxID=2419781 RepID=A0A4S3THM5_9EURY|nr:RNA-guided endonuclease TnpB family protein [Salinadaptatus halalkaliphilus]THE63402.1 transposase [Salinadaptatus halalkaliphilus]